MCQYNISGQHVNETSNCELQSADVQTLDSRESPEGNTSELERTESTGSVRADLLKDAAGAASQETGDSVVLLLLLTL